MFIIDLIMCSGKVLDWCVSSQVGQFRRVDIKSSASILAYQVKCVIIRLSCQVRWF